MPPFKMRRGLVSDERFEFELAEKLCMLHGEMLARMPHSEYVKWQALYRARASEAKPKKGSRAAADRDP